MTAPFRPVPRLRIGGDDLASGGDAARVALDGIHFRWGTADPLAQPEPATAEVRLLDRSRVWATTRADLIGQLLEIAYAAPDPEVPGYETAGRAFLGHIADVRVRPITENGRAVSLVELSCVSRVQSLANKRPASAFPAELLPARVARLNAQGWSGAIDSTLPKPLTTRADEDSAYASAGFAPVAHTEQVSLLEHLDTLYRSLGGDRWTYDPYLRRVLNVRRHRHDRRGMAGLFSDATAPPTYPGSVGSTRTGVYIRSQSVDSAGATTPPMAAAGTYRMYLDAHAIEYDVSEQGVLRGAGQYASALRLTWRDPAATTPYATANKDAAMVDVDPLVTGDRLATLDTALTTETHANLTLDQLSSRLRAEGRAWRLAPLVYRTDLHGGGFESRHLMHALLCSYEHEAVYFLAGSFLPTLGLAPWFSVQGADVSYTADDGWRLALELVAVTIAQSSHAITWPEIDDGSTANTVRIYLDGEDHPDGLHESVTVEDLGYVSLGLGVTTSGPDTGWDTDL